MYDFLNIIILYKIIIKFNNKELINIVNIFNKYNKYIYF